MEHLSRVDGEDRIKIDEIRVSGDGELRMRQRNERRVVNNDKGMYSRQEKGQIYRKQERNKL